MLVGQLGNEKLFHFGALVFDKRVESTCEKLSAKISAYGKIALLLNYDSSAVIAELSFLTIYFSRHRSKLEFSRSTFSARSEVYPSVSVLRKQ